MSQHAYELQDLWEVTNYGLAYIHEVFTQSVGCEDKKSKHFKMRASERTASASLFSDDRGVYKVYDHGYSDKPMNAVDLCMQEENLVFIEAMKFLFAKYGLSAKTPEALKPVVEWKDSKEKAGEYKIKWSKKTVNLSVFAPFLTNETANEYGLYSIDSYQKVTKAGKLKIVTATERYPIFGYNKDGWTKVYEPNAPKGDEYLLKHHFLGKKPERHIYGWERLFEQVDFDSLEKLIKDRAKATGKYKEGIQAEIDEEQLDSVFIATGGSDGLNLASLGYNVIWFNSETEKISPDEYYKLSIIAKHVYNLPDLDKTGVREAVDVGMKNLDLKTVWLPEKVNETPIKDLRDWITRYKNSNIEVVKSLFAKILSNAIEFKFWTWNDKRGAYSLDNKIMLYFLKHSGFYLYRITNNSADATNEIEETRLIHIEKNIIRVVSPRQVKNYVLHWLESRFIDRAVYNMIVKSIYFSENALQMLPEIQLNTKSGTRNVQHYFFQNKVVRITADGVEALKYDETDLLVWQNNIITQNFKPQEKHFTIVKDAEKGWQIDIHNLDSNYLKVLINSSRVYWKKDADANGKDTNRFGIKSDKLSEEENKIQQLQLINKMYCVGHLLHKFKIKSKSYMVLGIDRRIGKSAKDNKGGSGKSFLIESLYPFLRNRSVIDGRNLHKEDQKFLLDGVTKETDLIYYEDLSSYFDLNTLFNFVTGEKKANQKGGKIITISFEDFAKLALTMNAVPFDLTESLRRRMVIYECCDYYHEKSEDYSETRTIASDFDGQDIMREGYSEKDWNADFNFMLQCLQFYLSVDEKIEPSQENLLLRNLIQQIGEPSMKFMQSFFDDRDMMKQFGHLEDHKLWVHKKSVFDLYKEELGQKAKTSQDFKDILVSYCKTQNWEIEYKKKRIDGTGNSVVEHFFIDFGTPQDSLNHDVDI